jgi:hypothetical protein
MKALMLAIASLTLASGIHAQTATSPATSASNKSAASPPARTDVYRVYFGKAAAGKAGQLLDLLKAPDPKAPMPGHVLILRHQEGDAWDYVAIEHLGSKATVDATPFQVPSNMRDVTEWHNDTFVNGPSWEEFTRSMGMTADGAKSGGSVYVVSVYRPVPGHREDLEKFLGQPPDRAVDTSVGNVLMQHLEGSPWTFLTIARYNSWQDFATNEMNSQMAATKSKDAGWFQLRQHADFHNDTLTYRVGL